MSNNSTFSGINITGCTNQYLALAVLVFLFLCSEVLGIAPNSRTRSILHLIWTLVKQIYDLFYTKKPQPPRVKVKTEV